MPCAPVLARGDQGAHAASVVCRDGRVPVDDQRDAGRRFIDTKFDWFIANDCKENGDIESLGGRVTATCGNREAG